MSLPYAKVETYTIGGKVYPTEDAALMAAIEEVVGNPGVAGTVVRRATDLAPLLARVVELSAANSAAKP